MGRGSKVALLEDLRKGSLGDSQILSLSYPFIRFSIGNILNIVTTCHNSDNCTAAAGDQKKPFSLMATRLRSPCSPEDWRFES